MLPQANKIHGIKSFIISSQWVHIQKVFDDREVQKFKYSKVADGYTFAKVQNWATTTKTTSDDGGH